MSPTPVTYSTPGSPAGYTWEATNEAVAEKYGLPLERIARFDLNTAPAAPGLAARVLAEGRFEVGLSEYPPADYRHLVEAAAVRYGVGIDELLVGAGADEVLDLVAKTWLPPGGTAVVPSPTYAMFRILTEQRPAVVRSVARLGPDAGYALDLGATRSAARDTDLVWLCSPNNPTGLPEPDGLIAELLDGLAGDAAASGSEPPVVMLDEAYAEFVGGTLLELRRSYPRLVVVRTLSKAYALAGIRVGFAVARPEVIGRMEPYRPPGSLSVASVAIGTAALLDDSVVDENLERVVRERARVTAGLSAAGWRVGPSVTNFVLADFGSPATAGAVAEGLLRRGLVPRTFGPGHPLAGHLRLTIRDAEQDRRLIEAAREIALEGTLR